MPTDDSPSNDPTAHLPRGAIPTPRHLLAAAKPYAPPPDVTVPSTFLLWPCKMSMWGNDEYGDCTTAEEAFAKATAAPQTYLDDNFVIQWAAQNGFLNEASLYGVLKAMNTPPGMTYGSGYYLDGDFYSLDWTNAAAMQSAIYTCGPVKLGVGSAHFGSNEHGHTEGGVSGWALWGYPEGDSEDHCVSLCGYGNFQDLYQAMRPHLGSNPPAIPAGMPQGLCYAMYTWAGIGIIDEQSMLNMTKEAWVRNPVTTYISLGGHR